MNRRFFSGLLGAIFSTALCAGTLVNNSDGLPKATGVADGYALVIFSQPPLADWPNAARYKNGKLDFTAGGQRPQPGTPAPPPHRRPPTAQAPPFPPPQDPPVHYRPEVSLGACQRATHRLPSTAPRVPAA